LESARMPGWRTVGEHTRIWGEGASGGEGVSGARVPVEHASGGDNGRRATTALADCGL
jgi:hypothetical protein